MHKHSHLFVMAASLISMIPMTGCHDSDSSSSTTSECDFAGKKCHDNTTQECKDGKLIETKCPENTTCSDGDCISQTEEQCLNDMKPTCKNNQRVTCVNQKPQYEICPTGICDDGRCVECKSDLKDCQGSTTRRYCEEGMIKTETCPEICSAGQCTTKPMKCGDRIIDSDEFCDDGPLNGTYGYCRIDCQSIAQCGDGIVDSPDEACEPNPENLFKTCTSTCQKVASVFEDYPSVSNVSDEIIHNPPQCSEEDLFVKYLHYRERFIGNAAKNIPGFVSFGLEDGESLPSSARDPMGDCSKNWRFTECGYEDLPDAQGSYHYSDTSLWLGIMLHWLASEWKVFHELGLDTKETEKYIYYTLKAFDRLDLNAEKVLGLEPQLDGFFIRDDIGLEFYKKDGAYRFTRTDAPNQGYECAASGNTCSIHAGATAKSLVTGGTFVSQDQVTGIYEGYGMLIQFLPEGVIYEGMDLREHAMSTLHRIITFMRDSAWMLGVVVNGQRLQIPDAWGGYVQMLSGFFANASNRLIGDRYGITDYNDATSSLAYKGAATILDGFWDGWEIQNNYNRNLLLRLMAYDNFWDSDEYNKRAIMAGRDVYALMRALAQNENIADDYPLWEMHQILGTAPCGGPCSGSTCANPVPGWMGESYFISPRERISFSYFDTVDYNGLDYLIAHNLYFLSYLKKYGHGYSQKLPKDSSAVVSGLVSKYIYNQESFTTFDAKTTENAQDLTLQFCSKPLGDWIRDNVEGLSDIYINQMRWACDENMVCTLNEDPAPYQHKNALIIGSQQKTELNIQSNHHHCIVTFDGDDEITLDGGTAVIEAGNGNNNIIVTNAKAIIYTGDGNDTINAAGGMEFVVSGAGDDDITTDKYSDLIDAGSGNDTIHAGDGNNSILVHDGNNTVYLGNDNSYVRTEIGNNRIRAGNGDNTINVADGNTMLILGNGNNGINGTYLRAGKLHLCLGTGGNSVWGGWSNQCRANEASDTDFHNNTCPGERLSSEDCSIQSFNDWFSNSDNP